MIEESIFEDDLSRSCLVLSSHMDNCFKETYGRLGTRIVRPLDPDKFDNASSKMQEIGIRTLLVLGVAFSIVFAGVYIGLSAAILTLGSRALKTAGCYLQRKNFIHIKGDAKEVSMVNQNVKVMAWDAGTQKSDPQGLLPWASRQDRFIESIIKENPTNLVLLGVNNPIHAEKLREKLKNHYSHFYTHLGAKTEKENSYFIATKAAVANFDYKSFSHLQNGVAIYDLKKHPTDSEASLRIVSTEIKTETEAKELVEILKPLKHKRPTLFVGFTQKDLSHLLHYTYEGNTPSSELAKQYDPFIKTANSTQNLIALFRYKATLPVVENKLYCNWISSIRGFGESHDTRTAIADNHAAIVSLKFKK
jgi:hypothetical protein